MRQRSVLLYLETLFLLIGISCRTQTGWMCSRPALLVRKECYETNMIDQRRKLAEEKSIAEAEEAAKRIATVFLKSNEGILLVREQAMARMESSDKSRVNKVFKRLQVPSSIK